MFASCMRSVYRQAVPAEAHRDLRGEAQVAGHEPVGRINVLMLTPRRGVHVFLFPAQHREPVDFL